MSKSGSILSIVIMKKLKTGSRFAGMTAPAIVSKELTQNAQPSEGHQGASRRSEPVPGPHRGCQGGSTRAVLGESQAEEGQGDRLGSRVARGAGSVVFSEGDASCPPRLNETKIKTKKHFLITSAYRCLSMQPSVYSSRLFARGFSLRLPRIRRIHYRARSRPPIQQYALT